MSGSFFKVNHLFDGNPDARRSTLTRGGQPVNRPTGTGTSPSPAGQVFLDGPIPLVLQDGVPADPNQPPPRSLSAKRPVVKKVTTTVTTLEEEPIPPPRLSAPTAIVPPPDLPLLPPPPPVVVEEYRKNTRRSMYDLGGDRKYQMSIGPDEFPLPPGDREKYYHPDKRIKGFIRRNGGNDDDRFNVLEDSIDQPEIEYVPMTRTYVRALDMDDDPDVIATTTKTIKREALYQPKYDPDFIRRTGGVLTNPLEGIANGPQEPDFIRRRREIETSGNPYWPQNTTEVTTTTKTTKNMVSTGSLELISTWNDKLTAPRVLSRESKNEYQHH
jgi:hypothetical protein